MKIFIKTNDAQIFCRVFGKGEPIIVVHGGPGLSQDYLLPQMAKLAQTNLVIFYDQRGCGLSTGAINEDSIQIKTFVDDLEAIRKSFGYKKVTVLGHSWGGFLAMDCLRQAHFQDGFYHVERYMNLATKLFNVANQTMQVLLKYRSKGQQTVQVVHVHNEGQAIVAQNVSAMGGGMGKKSLD